ncbi:MAG: FAD-dependent thymidylate synthase [Candidatus Baltobacteraceae bacterium]
MLAEFNTHRTFCLDGETELYFDLPAARERSGTQRFTMTIREFFEKWHHGAAPRRREQLAAAELRSCNEETGEIYHTRVRDVTHSGLKPVFRVALTNGQTIAASKGHLFLTTEGWQRLEDAVGLCLSREKLVNWARRAEFAVNGIAAHTDPAWLPGVRDARFSTAYGAGRAEGTTVVRHFVPVASIEYLGEKETYDLEVEGPYHNFVADGFIVHNSRNSASSRAIPTSKLIERVESEPAVPLEWGRNKAGMSASELLGEEDAEEARRVWLSARDAAVAHARRLLEFGVHKQELNRLLEPFLWHTVIVTATEWENFFELRCAPNAQPEIRAAALAMRAAIGASVPQPLEYGAWHTPLLQSDEDGLDVETRRRVSAARCARVSYLTHEGKREIEKDLELYERLKVDRHLSPFEHVATPVGDREFHANFRGWRQMRREIEGSNGSAVVSV